MRGGWVCVGGGYAVRAGRPVVERGVTLHHGYFAKVPALRNRLMVRAWVSEWLDRSRLSGVSVPGGRGQRRTSGQAAKEAGGEEEKKGGAREGDGRGG